MNKAKKASPVKNQDCFFAKQNVENADLTEAKASKIEIIQTSYW